MPLTARHEGMGTVCGPLLDNQQWYEIYRPGSPLWCPDPDCEARMIAKVWKSSNLRFFAHHPDTPHTGSTAPESWEHLMLKAATATAVDRIKGWRAMVEQWGGLDGEHYRADVLAISNKGERLAFEVQHSKLHVTEAMERTRRMIADGVAYVTWLDFGVFPQTPLNTVRVWRQGTGPIREDSTAATPEGWQVRTKVGSSNLGGYMAETLARLARAAVRPNMVTDEVEAAAIAGWPTPAGDGLVGRPPAWPKCVECGNDLYLIRKGRDRCARCVPVFVRVT